MSSLSSLRIIFCIQWYKIIDLKFKTSFTVTQVRHIEHNRTVTRFKINFLVRFKILGEYKDTQGGLETKWIPRGLICMPKPK